MNEFAPFAELTAFAVLLGAFGFLVKWMVGTFTKTLDMISAQIEGNSLIQLNIYQYIMTNSHVSRYINEFAQGDEDKAVAEARQMYDMNLQAISETKAAILRMGDERLRK